MCDGRPSVSKRHVSWQEASRFFQPVLCSEKDHLVEGFLVRSNASYLNENYKKHKISELSRTVLLEDTLLFIVQ